MDKEKAARLYGKFTGQEIIAACDHTFLKQDATWSDIEKTCDEGLSAGTASICIPPSFVGQAADYVENKLCICTVAGFPLGYMTTSIKAFEAKDAVRNGANEIDMVINIGWLKDGKTDNIRDEIKAVKTACDGKLLKVIIETCLLNDYEKRVMCDVVVESGADYIKTSTGFAGQGATFDDVALMVKAVSGRIKVKAAGGIRSIEDAVRFLEIGANRLGTSSIIKLFS